MRVAHLTSVHPVRDARIYFKECRSLVAAGYDVSIVAPDALDGIDDCGIRQVSVRRGKGRFARMLTVTWSVFRRARSLNVQVCHFHDPELIPVGIALKLCGHRVIYDAHENTPDQILNKKWLPRPLRYLISRLVDVVELTAARAFDGVVAATPAIAQRYRHSDTVVVQNFPIRSEFIEPQPQAIDSAEAPFVYVGRIAEIRGIVEMVQAIGIARRERPQLRLIVAGLFATEALREKVMALPGWDGVDFVGWQSREQVAHLLARARAGLVVLHPTQSYLESYPVKLFEYMAAGIAVIASDFPLWRGIVDAAACGRMVDPLDPAAIARELLWMDRNPTDALRMGASGREAVASRFNWECEAPKLAGLYARLRASVQKKAQDA